MTTAERAKRYRERRRRNRIMARVEIGPDDVEALVIAGLLPPRDCFTVQEIEAALDEAITHVLDRRK